MRRTSPCTRIMGGSPADRCRSDALFFTLKARSWVISTCVPLGMSLQYALAGIMTTISDNLQAVQARIAHACAACGRRPDEVSLLAVSKTFGTEAVLEAARAGQLAF